MCCPLRLTLYTVVNFYKYTILSRIALLLTNIVSDLLPTGSHSLLWHLPARNVNGFIICLSNLVLWFNCSLTKLLAVKIPYPCISSFALCILTNCNQYAITAASWQTSLRMANAVLLYLCIRVSIQMNLTMALGGCWYEFLVEWSFFT